MQFRTARPDSEGRPEEQVPPADRPSKQLVRRLVASGADAPRVMIEEAVGRLGSAANAAAWTARRAYNDDADAAADAVVRSHARLARMQGAALGAAITGLEASPLFGPAGSLSAGAVAAGVAVDVTTLVWLQARMVLQIGAIYGHDASDAAHRTPELAAFFGVADLYRGAGPVAAGAAVTAGRRVVFRHLRGQTLSAVRAIARMGGLKFSRGRFLQLVPLVNIPIFTVTNRAVVRRLGVRAKDFYRGGT